MGKIVAELCCPRNFASGSNASRSPQKVTNETTIRTGIEYMIRRAMYVSIVPASKSWWARPGGRTHHTHDAEIRSKNRQRNPIR